MRVFDAVPCVAVAGLVCPFGSQYVVDGQVQCHNRVAALDTLEGLLVVARLRVFDAVPGVAVAGLPSPFARQNVVDGQMQGHYRVAALDTQETLLIVARFGVFHAVPLKDGTCCHRCVNRHVKTQIQVQDK